MTHDQNIPEDIRSLAEKLARLGAQERARGAEIIDRVIMRTTHELRPAAGAPVEGLLVRLRWVTLWLLTPAAALAAALLAIVSLRPGLPGGPDGQPAGVGVLAANLEQDIDTWAELDSMWRRDAFESNLAVLSLDAADVATRADELGSLTTLDGP